MINLLQGFLRLLGKGIVDDKDNPAERFWWGFWLNEKHDRATRLSHQLASDVAEERMKNDFFLQGARDNQVDLVFAKRGEDARRRIALLIIDRRLRRQSEFGQDLFETSRGFRRFLPT